MRMVAAYSLDLRQRALEAYAPNVSSAEVAEDLGVSASWVRKMRQRLQALGHLEPEVRPGPTPKIPPVARGKLLALVRRQPDATLPELVTAFHAQTGIRVAVRTMGRALRTLGLTRKKRASSRPKARASESSC